MSRLLAIEKTFVIPGVTESQNQWDKLHWGKRYAIRNYWFQAVRAYCGVSKCSVPARIKICRVSKRLIDVQNIGSATKPVVDALVNFGHLRGDGPADLLEFSVSQRKCGPGEEPCMIVTISYA